MEPVSLGSGNRICTVVFVDIVLYSEALVSRQVEMKAQFSALLATALEHTPSADRLVLDTGDGAALCFLGDPEDGLFAANSLRAGVLDLAETDALRLRIGVNLGPVRFVKDVNGQRNVIGDGINVAQRVMGFAAPNQILVSRSYYEVVSRLSPEYGQLFHYAGLHKDKHVREHEVYEVQLAPGARGRVSEPELTADAVVDPAAGPRFPPELLARAASALAREIGPVARLVVRKAADRATDVRALCEALALNVPERARRAFIAGFADVLGRRGDAGRAGAGRSGRDARTGGAGARPRGHPRDPGARRADAEPPDRPARPPPRARRREECQEPARPLREARPAHRQRRGSQALHRRSRSVSNSEGVAKPSAESLCAEGVEGLPVELKAVAGAVWRDGEAVLDAERLGDEAVEAEAVGLQVASGWAPRPGGAR